MKKGILWGVVCLMMLMGLYACGDGGGDGDGGGGTTPPISAKAITAYSLAGVTGTINETAKTISVTMPNGTNVTALVATFTTTGAGVKVGAVAQTSGTTPNNFTSPVVYTVTAADSTTATYTVTVTVAAEGTGTHTASGTYTWNSTTGVLTFNWTSSDFTCDGPDLGTETKTGVTITATTMTLPNSGAVTGTDMVFTRSSGTAGDIVGTWTSTESTGNSYTLTSNANGTLSLVGVIVQCSSDGGGGGTTLRILPGQSFLACIDTYTGKSYVTPQTLMAAGGSPFAGYTWSTSGFPMGTTVAPLTGVFSSNGGDLAGAGQQPFTVEVYDGTSTATGSVTLNVTTASSAPSGGVPGVGCPFAILQQYLSGSFALDDATANKPYGASLFVLGGTPPYSWSEDTSYSGRGDFALSGLTISRGIVRGTLFNSSAGKTLKFRVIVKDSAGDTAIGGPVYTITAQ